jgi:hypothetical protein
VGRQYHALIFYRNSTKFSLGLYKKKEDAARAHDVAAKKLHKNPILNKGEFLCHVI